MVIKTQQNIKIHEPQALIKYSCSLSLSSLSTIDDSIFEQCEPGYGSQIILENCSIVTVTLLAIWLKNLMRN